MTCTGCFSPSAASSVLVRGFRDLSGFKFVEGAYESFLTLFGLEAASTCRGRFCDRVRVSLGKSDSEWGHDGRLAVEKLSRSAGECAK